MWDEAVLRYSGCFTPVNLHIIKCIRINHFIIYMDTKSYLMCAYMLAAMSLSSAASAMTPSFPASQGSITFLRTILRTCYCIAIWKTYTPVLLKSRIQSAFTNMFAGLRQQLVSQLPEAMQGVVSKQFDAAQNQLLTKWFDWLPHLRRRHPLCDMRAS